MYVHTYNTFTLRQQCELERWGSIVSIGRIETYFCQNGLWLEQIQRWAELQWSWLKFYILFDCYHLWLLKSILMNTCSKTHMQINNIFLNNIIEMYSIDNLLLDL